MGELLKSASRMGMLAVILTTCLVFCYIAVVNATVDAVVIGIVTIFSNLVTGITVFYYTKKQTNPEVDKI